MAFEPSVLTGMRAQAVVALETEAPAMGATWEVELKPDANHLYANHTSVELLQYFSGSLVCQDCERQLANFDGRTVWTTGLHAPECSCRS